MQAVDLTRSQGRGRRAARISKSTSCCRWRTTRWPTSSGCGPNAACCFTVRRARARRPSAARWRIGSRGKFFLIDGTFIAGTEDFTSASTRCSKRPRTMRRRSFSSTTPTRFSKTARNAGLYRYLLTMIDGLESESAGRVCVMMTAMNVGESAAGPGPVRARGIVAGDEAAGCRGARRRFFRGTSARTCRRNCARWTCRALIAATEGFTGADLKRTGRRRQSHLRLRQSQTRRAKAAHGLFPARGRRGAGKQTALRRSRSSGRPAPQVSGVRIHSFVSRRTNCGWRQG